MEGNVRVAFGVNDDSTTDTLLDYRTSGVATCRKS